ncbi:sulfotransferase family 2 domain-containing protein [Paracoccus zeaxanthinifaciens]|uniref:sulfotransferase family 2 domain-containing protein n=1 Tax=Paracoccus zeaxanthinifaciens TaxID=187400 RepID=UPI00048BB437|nr:sulfotransferase family 2 domain-containing protein [Paracoccus zeaxanthinifaciens]
MLVSFDHKFIFIKTHKTASTSIEAALQPFACPSVPVKECQNEVITKRGIIGGRAHGSYKTFHAHMDATAIRNQVGFYTFRTFTKVVPIRNPFDKVVSWFFWRMPNETKESLKNRPFDETRFLFLNWLKMRPILPTNRQFYKVDGKDFHAYLIRYESLADDFAKLGEKLGLDLRWPDAPTYKKRAKTEGITTADYFDAAALKIVRDQFDYDFKRFGYSKDIA